MKKIIKSFFVVMLFVMTTGCTVGKMITLPENPLVFTWGSMEGDLVKSTYETIVCDDKVYVEYAQFSDYYGNKVDECIGYVKTDTFTPEIYVCTIVGLDGEEYLMTVNAMSHGVPNIYREISMQGDLEYEGIKPYGYPYWDK